MFNPYIAVQRYEPSRNLLSLKRLQTKTCKSWLSSINIWQNYILNFYDKYYFDAILIIHAMLLIHRYYLIYYHCSLLLQFADNNFLVRDKNFIESHLSQTDYRK